MRERFNKRGFQEGSLLRFCLTNAYFGSLFFAPCASQGIEQAILGTVILKLPIGSPCDGHQEQGKTGREQPALPTAGEEVT